MIKEDHIGDTNKLERSMNWAVSVPKGPENCRMGQEAGSFYKVKNKEQGRDR